MQAASFGLVATFIGILALSIALAITFVAPIIAVAIFIVVFGAFLIWRAKRGTEENLGNQYTRRVPTTEETAADPAADSGTADVARSRSDARTRHGHA
jgi:predicted membrane protein